MSLSQQKVYVVVHLYMKEVVEIVDVFLSEDAAEKLCETLSNRYNDPDNPVRLPGCEFIVFESTLNES